ncbi:T9SS type A sorting domain-containing protein [Flavobacterium sp. SUN046]|uniref:T9SS type A sorting domain-containing protein n=1 Tax=Flavobacterium sp. SUN046 TaxID=3002440 RepID=UPI002DBF17B0|nr:T9SS type A sorting domain-containing protein [Flavobacterium sp. SUN046]MEC4048341.1 T9SS type A sorting domain-containing protein [Flavobacterium sp. SUN046]
MKSTLLKLTFVFALFSSTSLFAQKILFDATKAEMAGSADWVIDADAHNIYFNSTTHLPYVSGSGGASNPQKIPTLAQSGITSTTAETYWDGALSAFAVDCVKQGYTVETLPFNGLITYGNSSNTQDLSNYKCFVIDEPNSSFTAVEKAAIINFVMNGGGLMMICDHTVSDRNFDGVDSPVVWNDLLTNNTVQNNPFGITFDLVNISGNSTTIAPLTLTSPYYSILHGAYGVPSQVYWSNGTTMTLSTTNNSSVKGIVFKSGSSTSGSTNVLVAAATYVNGKVFAVGDSSIIDDGTGDPNDTLYTGYTGDANGNHEKLLMNGLIWLMTNSLGASNTIFDATHFAIAPNPIHDKQLHFSFSIENTQNTSIAIYDNLGRTVKEIELTDLNSGVNYKSVDVSNLQEGIYFCKLSAGNETKTLRVIVE